MNKDNFENIETVKTTENEETDFSPSGLLAFFNVTVDLFGMMFLGTIGLLDFTKKDSGPDNSLHEYIFSDFVEKQSTSLSITTIWIFLIALAAMIVSFIFNRKKEKHLFLMLSTGLNVTAGVYYLLAHLLWANCEFTGSIGSLIFYGVLLAIGIAGLIWGLCFHKSKDEPRIKKWIPITLAGVLVLATGVCIAYPLVTLNAEYKEVNALRQTIAAQETGYDEKIGYQIGNYVEGNALFVEDKLYLLSYDSGMYNREIISIDKSGAMETFWSAPEIRDIDNYFHYYNGYLYVLADTKETSYEDNRLLRISLADGSAETLLETEDAYSFFGIRNDLLLIAGYDNGRTCIYAYDLTKPITEDSGYLYDYDLWVFRFDREYFVNHYLYGHTLVHKYGSADYPEMCVEDNRYGIYNRIGIYGPLCLWEPEVDWDTGTPIDSSSCIALNIFDNTLYYIRYTDDYETYEVYTCDLSGENKMLIGTMPAELFTDCYTLGAAEDFLVFYGVDRETEEDIAYLMWLKDGSYEKLW